MGFSLNEMDAMPVPTKRWARVEYERLVDRAVFQPGDRVELVGGQLDAVAGEPARGSRSVGRRSYTVGVRIGLGSAGPDAGGARR
jgi:hypothetical protein